jgi:RNA polymerase sigma factor (sigma-70 family)
MEEVPERLSRSGLPEIWNGELWDALARLPDKQRAAVAYHYVADLPYKEIADITGGSTDAARRAAADGIKTLRATYRHATDVEGARS